LLLGELVSELGRRSDPRFERVTPVRFERPVRERGQLGDLPVIVLVCSTTSHRHDTSNGNAESAQPRGELGSTAHRIISHGRTPPGCLPFP
jgi:hypothetical protein